MRINVVRDIFVRDIKRLAHNWVAVIVVLGIMVLPSLYAWFNIGANMDPYSNTGNIKVGVVCDDKGAKTKETGEINIGQMIVDNLKENDSIGWEFVSDKEADKGIKKGKYYATIIIPENFSQDMISFVKGKVEKPTLKYYVNEKKNAVAPKVTGTAASTVQREINEKFMGVVSDTITKTLGQTADEMTSELSKASSQANKDLRSVETSITAYQKVISRSHKVIASNKSAAAKAKSKLEDAQKKNDAFAKKVSEDKLLLPEVKSRLITVSELITPDIQRMLGVVDGFDKSMTSLDSALSSTSDTLTIGAQQVEGIESGIKAINGSDLVKQLGKITGLNSGEISEFMQSPIEIEEKVFYSVRDYGSGMAPFYTMLAIWVGGIILLALFKTEVDQEGIQETIKPSEAYLGRWLLLVVLGIVQGFIVCLGDILLLGIQCIHPVLFMITGLLASIVFVTLIYALTTSFRHIGKALVIILAILQIPGSSGTYPIEMTGTFFQSIHPILPFTYGIGAMREAIAGTYKSLYVRNLLLLGLFFLVAMFIGLVLRFTVLNLNRMLDIELGKTGLVETEGIGEEYSYKKIRRIKNAIENDDKLAETLRVRREKFEANYELRSKQGIECLIFIPSVLMLFMFVSEYKMLALALWIITLIVIAVILLTLEYRHSRYREMDGGDSDA